MKTAKFFLFLSTCLFAIHTQAQQSIKGYYVDLSGVRQEASFTFGFDQEDYEQFVVLGDNDQKTLTAELVREVGFENGRIFRAEVLPENPAKVFALVLRDGEIDLLKWQRKYFVKSGDQIVALKELVSTKEVNGQETKVVTKQYQGVLMSLLKPNPDQENLAKAIRTASLNDRDLTRIVDVYHEVNGLSIDQVAVTKQGPAFLTKLKIQAGIGAQSLIKNFENQGFSYGFESGIAPYLEAGVRFKDFRNAPRLAVDLGLGYYAESDVIEASVSQISFDLEGTQTFKASSVVVPLGINYILAKGSSSEFYAGTGLTFWFSSYTNESAELIMDNGEPDPIIHTDEFVLRKSTSVSPNLKLGWAKSLSAKTQLFVEAKGDLLIKNYEMIPFTYYAVYNLGVLTFSAGIAF